MRLHIAVLAGIALAGMPVSTDVTSASTARDAQAVRTIPWAPSPPIPERLLAGDTFVIVAAAEDPAPVRRSARPPRAVLRQSVEAEFGTTAVVDVRAAVAALSEDGTWVQTRFTAVVREVLRQGPGVPVDERLAVGRQMEFRLGGGEIVINGVRVRAGQSVVFRPGEYLVFVAHKSGPTWWTLADQPPLAVRGGRLAVVPPSTSALAGLRMSDVRAAVRRASGSK